MVQQHLLNMRLNIRLLLLLGQLRVGTLLRGFSAQVLLARGAVLQQAFPFAALGALAILLRTWQNVVIAQGSSPRVRVRAVFVGRFGEQAGQ